LFKISSNAPYYIVLEGYPCSVDSFVANYLRIPLKEYRNILLKFNAYKVIDDECYFHNYDDARNCVNYLTEKFEIMIKLTKE